MDWRAQYAAAATTRERCEIIRAYRRAWFEECGCWPTWQEVAQQLHCGTRMVSQALAPSRILIRRRG